MFSKPIFKQTAKSNWKLWLIFTLILCAMNVAVISVFNPDTISSMLSAVEGTAVAEAMGERASMMSSLLGMLSSNFYGLLAVLLPLIYIIITANSLVAAQVDKGSMAYTLSTPVKRSKVIGTQAIYLILATLAMVLVVTLSGMGVIQATQGGVFTKNYTSDVEAAAVVLNMDKEDVSNDIQLIAENEEAVKAGAEARGVDEEVYTLYLSQKVMDNALQAAADAMGITVEELEQNPALLTESEAGLAAAAEVGHMSVDELKEGIEVTLAQEEESGISEEDMQEQFVAGFSAAAEVLGMEMTDLTADLGLLKENPDAMAAAVEASGFPEEQLTMLVNYALASSEVSADEQLEFDVPTYLMINLGWFLFLFAIGSISFAASCIFNLSKNSLALGAGLPVAFFVFKMLAQTGDGLEMFKYLSLNTLFDPNAILAGSGYGVQFVILAVVGIVLYIVGMEWFKRKDLPL
ncbi:MAG: hypothetical protein ACI3W5_12185 [Faecousia sp.]